MNNAAVPACPLQWGPGEEKPRCSGGGLFYFFLTVFDSRNLSTSERRKRTRRSSLIYGRPFFFIKLFKVRREI